MRVGFQAFQFLKLLDDGQTMGLHRLCGFVQTMGMKITFRYLLFAVIFFMAGCDQGGNSSLESNQYLFITDSLGRGVGEMPGYVELISLPGIHLSEVPAVGSPEVLDAMEEYALLFEDLSIDTVWINMGLWDAIDGFTPITPIDEYAENVEQIFQAFLDLGVQVIWCETTNTDNKGVNDYIFDLNVVADTIAMDFGIPIFEMAYLQQANDWQLAYDGLHFTADSVVSQAMEVEKFLISITR